MLSSLSRGSAFLGKILSVVLPFSRRRFVIVVVSMIVVAILQLGGVASVLPFLSVAANPEGFAASELGSSLVSWLNLTDSRQLVYVTGILAIVSLVVASASTILSQIMTARYVGDLGHWLRMQLIAKYYSQPYLYFVSRNSAVLTKKANADVNLFTAFLLSSSMRFYGTPFHHRGDCRRTARLGTGRHLDCRLLLCGILFYFHADHSEEGAFNQ